MVLVCCLLVLLLIHSPELRLLPEEEQPAAEGLQLSCLRWGLEIEITHPLHPQLYNMYNIVCTLHHLFSSSLLLGKHLVHVGYRKENSNLLVVGLPAERYADSAPSNK